MLRYTPGRFLPLAGSDSRTDCEAVRKSFLHSFYTLSTGLTNGVGIFAHCNGVASGLRALDGGWADCAYGHPVRTFTGLPFYAKDFLQLCQIRAESETICTTFRTVGSDTFSNPHGLQGHSTRPHAAVACLPCVFYIVSHLSDFVKHFFRFVGSGTFYIQSSIPYGSQYRTLCPRRRLGLIDCTWIVSHFRKFVKREFSRPLRLTVSTHGHAFLRCVSGLRFCASVFGFPLPVFPSCFRYRRSWPHPSMSPWRISDKLSCVDCMRFERCNPLPDGKGRIGAACGLFPSGYNHTITSCLKCQHIFSRK